MKRFTITIDDEVFLAIEKERGKKLPIPSFSKYVRELIMEALDLRVVKVTMAKK